MSRAQFPRADCGSPAGFPSSRTFHRRRSNSSGVPLLRKAMFLMASRLLTISTSRGHRVSHIRHVVQNQSMGSESSPRSALWISFLTVMGVSSSSLQGHVAVHVPHWKQTAGARDDSSRNSSLLSKSTQIAESEVIFTHPPRLLHLEGCSIPSSA